MGKRVFAWLLSFAMLVSFLPNTALADELDGENSITEAKQSVNEDANGTQTETTAVLKEEDKEQTSEETLLTPDVTDIQTGALLGGNTEIIASGECGADGDNVTWTLDANGVLIISGTGDMADYLYPVHSPWTDNKSQITEAIIESGVTNIGDEAFHNCTFLSNVTISNSVTSIQDGVFAGCSSLISIDVEADNPAYCSVDGILFDKNQTQLIRYPGKLDKKSYSIPDSVTSIGNSAFSYCAALTNVTIPNSVSSIGNSAFVTIQSRGERAANRKYTESLQKIHTDFTNL